MKYLKTFEQKSDEIVYKIKNKFNLELESEFSKYLKPEFIKLGGKDVKVFLLHPDFGVRINIDFTKYPYVLYANICIVFLENGKWKRSAYTKYYKSISSQEKISREGFVKKYVSGVELKYQSRMNRILKKNISKYNL
jgi:hypothetical protein